MSPSASQLLHAYHGAPIVDGCADVACVCWVCGAASTRGMPRAEWMGANFTGQNRVRCPSSAHVCEACVWAMAGRPPDTLRMYSHLLTVGPDGGGYVRANKGHKPALRSWLRATHAGTWFAAIADSGQKHVIPWAPVNPPGARGRIRFEEDDIALPDAEGWRVVDDLTELLTAGATKEEIDRGHYGSRAWALCGPIVRAFERDWGSLRGGPWFRLAVWLAQRDEERVGRRLEAEKDEKRGKAQRRTDGATADAHGGGVARRARRVPRDAGMQSAQALGPTRGADALGGAQVDDGGRMGNAAAARPATAVSEQLGFAFDPGPRRGGA